MAGVSYLLFTTSIEPGWAMDSLDYQNRVAFHFAIGTDLNITKHWFINIEARKFFSDYSNVNINLVEAIGGWEIKTHLKTDPINFTAGIGYRF